MKRVLVFAEKTANYVVCNEADSLKRVDALTSCNKHLAVTLLKFWCFLRWQRYKKKSGMPCGMHGCSPAR